MIFQHTWEKVLDGSKTQTRRIVKPGESANGEYTSCLKAGVPCLQGGVARENGTNAWCDGVGTGGVGYPYPPSCIGALKVIEQVRDGNYRLKWQVGRTYAVQPGRGKAAIGRIRITAIRKERVQDITEEDAFAEGCKKGEIWESGPNELGYTFKFQTKAQFEFKTLWEEVHGPGAWERNDGVWVLEYELVTEAEPA